MDGLIPEYVIIIFFLSSFFYVHVIIAYWTSDKVEYQVELATRISDLILVSQYPQITIKFIKAFFFIMNREWLTIDHYRMDKFYKLLRTFLYRSLDFLHLFHWDLTVVNAFSKLILEEEIIRPDEPLPSDIFRFTKNLILPHLWEEYKDVCIFYFILFYLFVLIIYNSYLYFLYQLFNTYRILYLLFTIDACLMIFFSTSFIHYIYNNNN